MTSDASEVVDHSDLFFPQKAFALWGFLLKTQERNLLPRFASWCYGQDAVLGVFRGAG